MVSTLKPIKKPIMQYDGSGTTNDYGNLAINTNIVRPSTGVILGVSNDGNYKAVVIGQSTNDAWTLRFYNYATTNMNSVANTSVSYRIYYQLY